MGYPVGVNAELQELPRYIGRIHEAMVPAGQAAAPGVSWWAGSGMLGCKC